MKKVFLTMFVALCATMVGFTSCSKDDKLSDDDLAKNIINNGYFTDGETSDLDELYVTASRAMYTYDGSILTDGTWAVQGGVLIITNTSSEAVFGIGDKMSLTISDEGKTLTTADHTVLKKAKK